MTVPTFVFRAVSSSAPDADEWRADYIQRLKAAITQRKRPEGEDEQTNEPTTIPED